MRLKHPVPGNNRVWVVEMTPSDSEETANDLLSCLLRGWVEVFEDGVPSSQLRADGSLPAGPLLQQAKPVYRMTDSGWSVVRGTHTIAVWGMAVAFLSLAAAIFAVTLEMRPNDIVSDQPLVSHPAPTRPSASTPVSNPRPRG
jgi:hypothetical protein